MLNKKYLVKTDVKNSNDAVDLAKKIVLDKKEEDKLSQETFRRLIRTAGLSQEEKNYVYLEGTTVSDLIVIEYNRKNGQFLFRKSTSEEWKAYFDSYVK